MAQSPVVRSAGLSKNSTWLALAPLALLAFGLALWGFYRPCTFESCPSSLFERVMRSLDLARGRGNFVFGRDPWQLALAQALLPLAALLAAAKLFLISLRRDLRIVLARRARNHHVVCGLGETGRGVVEMLRAKGERVVAIDREAGCPNAPTVEGLGTPLIPGDAKSRAVLKVAGLRRAKALVLCTGDDTVNLEIALGIVANAASVLRPAGRITVISEMRTGWLFERFLAQSGAGLGSDRVAFRILNLDESAGRLLFRAPCFAALAAPGSARTDLAIVGFGDMGRAVAAQGIRTAFALPARRPRLIAFDARGEEARSGLAALYPGVEAVADVELRKARVVQGEPTSWDPIHAALAPGRLAALVICLPDDGDALFAAARAREALDEDGEFAVPVFVRVEGRRKLADVMADMDARPWLGGRLVPFGDRAELLAAGLLGDGAIDGLARACHEAYLDTLANEPASNAPSRRPWADLPELFKRSNRLFADHIETKLRAAGLRSCPAAAPRGFDLTEQDRETLAEAEHGRWLVERRMAGWRHGATRDDARLRHPDLVEWAALPTAVRARGRETAARIPAILARIGREVRRERVVAYDPNAPGTAGAALDAFDPAGSEHLVVVLDPTDARARALALRAASIGNVTLRLDLRGLRAGAALSLAAEDAERLRRATDGCLDPDGTS